MQITKIISGGQTGADYGGLVAGRNCAIKTGGTAPKGWRTDAGSNPELETFGLVEHTSSAYQPRTKANVIDGDITLIFGNPNSPGGKLTRRYCAENGKRFLLIPEFTNFYFVSVHDFIKNHFEGEITINVAGNRESGSPGIEEKVIQFMTKLIDMING